MERLHSIQYLRAAAAFAVVLYHAFASTPVNFYIGAAGVDVFFVISGFIIGAIALETGAAPGPFLWRRFIRVYPPYWAVTALILLVIAVRPAMYPNADLSFDNIWTSLLLAPHVAREGSPAPILMQGWTLYYEIFFYLAVAAVLPAPARLRAPLLFGALIALVVLGRIFDNENPIWDTVTGRLLVEFLAGVAIAMAWRRGLVLPPLVGLLCIVGGVAIYVVTHFAHFSGAADWRWLVWGGPAAMIIAGAVGLDAAKRVPYVAPLERLGDASYSLYLLHDVVLVVTSWGLAAIAPTLPLVVQVPVKVAAAVAAALVFYAVFERPALLWLKDLPKTLRRTPAFSRTKA